MDWVVAEFVRLYHNVTATEAFSIVQGLVSPKVPAIQEFNGQPMVLNPNLNYEQCILLLLYRAGSPGARWHELYKWMPQNHLRNLQSALENFIHTKYYVHFDTMTGYYELTGAGIKEVQKSRIADGL
jgi:hypothetical protein